MFSEESGREKLNIADISDEKLLALIDLVRKTFSKLFKVKYARSFGVFSLNII